MFVGIYFFATVFAFDDSESKLAPESLLHRRRLVGTYEECTQKSCTDIANCAGDVTCTGPDDSTCSQCDTGFSGDTCTPNPPAPSPTTTTAPPATTPQYQQTEFGGPSCPPELEITSQAECSDAITSLGFTDFPVWTSPRLTMPKGCSIQKDTNSMIWNFVPAGSARHDLAPVCRVAGTAPAPAPATTTAPPGTAPQYQIMNYRWPGCPTGFEITTQAECTEAFASLGITDFGTWVDSKTTMPKGCSIQKDTNQLIWNDIDAETSGRHDLRPVCKWTGTPTPPEPTPAPVPVTRDTTTVTDNEWAYFLAFQESRRVGFSCPCGDLDWISCNGIGGEGKHFHEPNPEKVTFDCTLWIAAYQHAEDQAIQNYCSHTGKDGRSPRQRAEAVGAKGGGEHQACRHNWGPDALAGLQTSPGHCNSMYNPDFKGFAVGYGFTMRDIWTVMYNGGGDDISDSTSCIPAGYNAQGDRI